MRLLLDTHALLWWLSEPDRLSRRAREAIAEAELPTLVSVVSAYEIANKHRRGRLPGAERLVLNFKGEIAAERFVTLELTLDHALRAGALAFPHADPFDRLLMAQALAEGLLLVTVDRAITTSGVPCLW